MKPGLIKILFLLTLCLLLCTVSLVGQAQELRGVVTNVIDGNTIEIMTAEDEAVKILIHGIDSPEPGQSYYEQAKQLLEKLVLNKTAEVTLFGRDRHGTRLGLISIEGSSDPHHELVKAGLAWTSEHNSLADLEQLQEAARKEGRGLWKDPNPVPPWTFRKQQTMAEAKSN